MSCLRANARHIDSVTRQLEEDEQRKKSEKREGSSLDHRELLSNLQHLLALSDKSAVRCTKHFLWRQWKLAATERLQHVVEFIKVAVAFFQLPDETKVRQSLAEAHTKVAG